MVASLPGAPHWNQGPSQAEAAKPNTHGATNLHDFFLRKCLNSIFFCSASCRKKIRKICNGNLLTRRSTVIIQKSRYPHKLHFFIINRCQANKPVPPVLTFSQQREFPYSKKITVRWKKYNDLRVLNNSPSDFDT